MTTKEECELFNKMIAHHLKSLETSRSEDSKLYHREMYTVAKKTLWELSPNAQEWAKKRNPADIK